MTRISHISTVHSLYDDRIFYKECKSLKKEGYNVFYIVKTQGDKSIDGINIIGVKNYNSRLQRVIFGSIEAFRKAVKIKSDLYHFHDPELMFTGVLLKLAGKKVVYDVHEDLPTQVLYKDWIRYKFIRKTLSAIINVFEQFCCLFFDGIVTATEDIAKKFSKRKTIVLRNFPVKSMIEKTHSPSIKKEKNIIIYVGGLSKIRGIKEIIQAMEHVNTNYELWLIGKFENEEYYEECKNLSSWKRVKHLGFKKLDEVYGYIKLADIGLAILYPIKNYLTSLPVKTFEYMAFG
ncbi:MAG: glycosyltransferase, partial [Bacteroidales bacterium]|nr:glycosyltransferase [Bacteroidales bacterium]